MEEIMKAVSSHTGYTEEDIKSRSRTHGICEARRIFMYLSHNMNGRSLKEVAMRIDRTHQNVSAQLISFDQHLRIYKGLRNRVEEIKNAII